MASASAFAEVIPRSLRGGPEAPFLFFPQALEFIRAERGCVEDQPQRAKRAKAAGMLRLAVAG